MSAKTCMLQALRARLLLDQGMGVEFAACTEEELRALVSAVESASSPLPSSPDIPSAKISDERRDGAPESVARSAVPVRETIPKREPAAKPAYLVPDIAAQAVNPVKEAELAELRREAMSCEACGLCAKRNSVVWGEGSLDARVMFIGEGPGRDEDLEGRPFVGRSGRVLTDIIEKGMKVPRGEVYIANVVKCRPPGNREPKPDEVTACARYLTKQIEVIRPRVIVAVGGVAGCALLRLPPKSSGLRGRWHEFEGVPLRVIFHPSYLLRQRKHESDRTSADRDTWKDIVEVMKKLNDV